MLTLSAVRLGEVAAECKMKPGHRSKFVDMLRETVVDMLVSAGAEEVRSGESPGTSAR